MMTKNKNTEEVGCRGANMSWEEIQDEYESRSGMSRCPVELSKVPNNHIFDKDKSVKWNEEQIKRNNQQYCDEVARLNTERNKALDNVLELIYDKIQYEVGHRISRKKSSSNLGLCL